MEHAGVVAEPGPRDLLEQDLVLDFDSNVEFGAERLDFGQGGQHNELQHGLTGDFADDASAPNPDPKLGSGDEEARTVVAGDGHAQPTETSEDVGSNVETEAEYQDEIGYEDDDFVATDVNDDFGAPEAGEPQVGLPDVLPKGHLESAPLTNDSRTETLPRDQDASWDQDIDFGEQGDANDQNEHGEGEEEEEEDDAAAHLEGHTLSVDDEMAHAAADRRESDLEEALEDLTSSLAEVPDISVLMDDECFSLFGTPDDDPDSYFLSDAQELDRPLSQFLSAIRAVMSDDIAPTDELVLCVQPLGLEFGERSNERFLRRTFREIWECYTTLREASAITGNMVIHLTVRRDSEEHYLELLAQAEAAAKGSSPDAEDSDVSENLDDEYEVSGQEHGETEYETFEDEYASEHRGEGEHVGGATVHDRNPAHDVQDRNEPELGFDHQDGMAEARVQDAQGGITQSHSPKDHTVEFGGEDGSGYVSEAHADSPGYAEDEDEADEAQAWDVQGTEGDATVSHHSDVVSADAHQPTSQQGDEESTEAPDYIEAHGVTAPGNGESEQDAPSNDDDLVLVFDDEPGSTTIAENTDDKPNTPYDAPADVADDVLEASHERRGAEITVDSTSVNFQDEDHLAAAVETASVHTSTTVNGNPIGYDEHIGADDSSTPANEGMEQPAASVDIQGDEIDWENDEDEDEQQSTSDHEGAELEESNETAPSPPSVAGKRSRTDEAESLADETDYKRRRT
ncbi:fb845856-72e7-4abd-8fdd-6aa69be8c9f2 [Thermothielavioides terrestris]|uniref:Fb845856-72e7-4abd-8fdd-6aa69be8c9f2 n=1 Tax=Thermothielavioides terrestris TaxID=2587410 RepID=A0A446BKD4_9PEZI|nr:fb845856-72e7-4abd-8fdd-6aa69be8c9f2 [Thermothielavioides terrestris]